MKMSTGEGPLETAVRLLTKRDHTEKELRDKLRQRNFSSADITNTVEELRVKGYLNDETIKIRLIEKWVEKKHCGIWAIKEKLMQLGLVVSEEQVRAACSEDTEKEIAVLLLRKRFGTFEKETPGKIASFLCNRGFSSHIINPLIEECRKHQ